MRFLRLDRRETADLVSGTALRDMLLRGERPPAEFTRPEVADVLIEAMGAAPPAADGDGLVSRHTASQS